MLSNKKGKDRITPFYIIKIHYILYYILPEKPSVFGHFWKKCWEKIPFRKFIPVLSGN